MGDVVASDVGGLHGLFAFGALLWGFRGVLADDGTGRGTADGSDVPDVQVACIVFGVHGLSTPG